MNELPQIPDISKKGSLINSNIFSSFTTTFNFFKSIQSYLVQLHEYINSRPDLSESIMPASFINNLKNNKDFISLNKDLQIGSFDTTIINGNTYKLTRQDETTFILTEDILEKTINFNKMIVQVNDINGVVLSPILTKSVNSLNIIFTEQPSNNCTILLF